MKKLSKAQQKVVDNLRDNEWLVAPSPYYNHQTYLGKNKEGKIELKGQFKKPTLEVLLSKNILVPIGDKGYLTLNPKLLKQ